MRDIDNLIESVRNKMAFILIRIYTIVSQFSTLRFWYRARGAAPTLRFWYRARGATPTLALY